MLRRYVPVALSVLGYMSATLGAALYDARLALFVIAAAAIYEAREAIRT